VYPRELGTVVHEVRDGLSRGGGEMSDGVLQGLMDSVRAAPLDDPPRWVLADYLQSSGDVERARFVRLQLESARLESWDPGRVLSTIRQRALLQTYEAAWRAELPEIEGVKWGRFERGLVNRASFDSVQALAEHAATRSRATPLTHVVLRWRRLDRSIQLAPIEGLEEVTFVGTLMQPEDLAWLADSPLLSTVRTLNLIESQMDANALGLLLASPHLQRLEALRLPLHDFGNAGVDLLVQASLPKLVDLDLSVPVLDDLGSGGRYEPTLDAVGAAALARWPGLAGVHTLDLTGNQIEIDGLTAILSSPHAANLKTLRIRGVADWDEDEDDKPDVLAALAATCEGMRLDELDISECDLTDVSGPALIASPALGHLKVLRFDYTHSDPFRHVVAAPCSASLRILSANDCGGVAINILLQRAMPNLHTLSLASSYGWSIAKDIAVLLAAAPPQASLLSLDLTGSGLSGKGLDRLGTVSSLPALVALKLGDLDEADFEEEDVARFAASPLGARLESLTCGVPEVDRAPEPAPVTLSTREYRGPLREL
jgi:uncharacterized protein (TIGR02996 family)